MTLLEKVNNSANSTLFKLYKEGLFYKCNNNSSNGSLDDVGSRGTYWSSAIDGTNSRNLNFNISSANMNSNRRAFGLSVRCIKD